MHRRERHTALSRRFKIISFLRTLAHRRSQAVHTRTRERGKRSELIVGAATLLSDLTLVGDAFSISRPRGLTFTWWGCCGLYLLHKPAELAHSFSFCSCVYFCLYGPFNCISFRKFSRQLSAFYSVFFPTLFLPYWSFRLFSPYESLLQPWYYPLWLTGLKAPTSWILHLPSRNVYCEFQLYENQIAFPVFPCALVCERRWCARCLVLPKWKMTPKLLPFCVFSSTPSQQQNGAEMMCCWGIRQEGRWMKNNRPWGLVCLFGNCLFVCLFICLFPQWRAADAEIKVPSDENTELKHSLFKARSRSVYSHTCYAYCRGFRPC